jgi:hypothetical protein
MNPEHKSEIAELIFCGNKIMAIKQLRDVTGLDLLFAKEQVERLEADLMNRYPERFGLPGTHKRVKQVERILTEGDFLDAISKSTSGWSLKSFENIPMGWLATLTNERRELKIWSHRSDIEASVAPYNDPVRDRDMLHPFPTTLSDYQQIHHILDSAP